MGIIIMLDKLFYKLGSIPKEELNFGFSIGKRLDEHREEVESIANSAEYFQQEDWRVGHFAIQDNYLMRLCHLVYGYWPDDTSRTQSVFVKVVVIVFVLKLLVACLSLYQGSMLLLRLAHRS